MGNCPMGTQIQIVHSLFINVRYYSFFFAGTPVWLWVQAIFAREMFVQLLEQEPVFFFWINVYFPNESHKYGLLA